MHRKSDRTRRGHLQHRPVYPAHVVAKQQYAAFLRDIFDAVDVDRIADPKKRHDKQTREKMRQVFYRRQRADKHAKGGNDENPRRTNGKYAKRHSKQQKRRHKDVLDEVAARQRAAHLLFGREKLDICV